MTFRNTLAFEVLRSCYRKVVPNTFATWEFDVIAKYNSCKKDIFFIQIGSNNGKNNDPIYPHIIENNWRGILVEPVKYLFDNLVETYNRSTHLIFENSAIAVENGQLSFYRLAKSDLPGLPEWYDQLGSFNKSVVLKHRDQIPHFDELFLEDKVDSITLNRLLEKHKVSKVDLLHIDTEGYDYEILKMIPFNIGIDIIMFEHWHLSELDYRNAKRLLTRNGYVVKRSGDADTLGIKRKLLSKLLI